MAFQSIKHFALVLDGPDDAVYNSGEMVTGVVVLELNRDIKVRALRVHGRGVATAHWLENRSVGVNTVYNDYTSKITYFRKRQHLIRETHVVHVQTSEDAARDSWHRTDNAEQVCRLLNHSSV